MKATKRIGVLGVGNVLMGDDGVGPFLVKILESRYEFPSNVVLRDLGIPGLGITPFFADYDAIILLQALCAKAEPGAIRLYRKSQLVRVPIPQCVNPHDPALVRALLFAEFGEICPQEVLLVGVVPKATKLGCSLTQEVKSAVVSAIAAVLAELHRLGAEARLHVNAAFPSLRWQEKVVSKCVSGEAQHVPGYPG
jgi:hydrogenase maturation protease